MTEQIHPPAVSVVSVYNDSKVLENCLINSLRKQDIEFEWIPVDNTSGRFHSASVALNHGFKQAKGRIILYAHQDVVFLEPNSLRQIVENVDRIGPNLGWAGIAGKDGNGIWRGLLRDRDFIAGEPFDFFQEVQTLDELLLCTKRDSHACFDEQLHGWHAYGVDACCSALRRGKRNYVIATSVWHASRGLNLAKLKESHEFIYRKHFASLGPIMTTCGRIPKQKFAWRGAYRLAKTAEWLQRNAFLFRLGIRPTDKKVHNLSHLLDDLTSDRKRILCHRGKYSAPRFDSIGLCSQTKSPRYVVHEFGKVEGDIDQYDAHVFFPDGLYKDLIERELDRGAFVIQILEVNKNLPKSTGWKHRFTNHYMTTGLDARMFLVSTSH
jgi:hypothetical protein